MYSAFFIVVAILSLMLTMMWKKDTWLNFTLKFTFLFLAIWGGILAAHSLGYIVRP